MITLMSKLIDKFLIKKRDPRGRNQTITTEEYLKVILKILRSGSQWY